jgi:alkylhydroperoxidase/carboxymuconolactone decarboxylase family protein YurZ
MEDARAKGLAIFREVYGEEMAQGVARTADSGAPFVGEQSRWTLEWAFGSVWAREQMERKLRSCAVLGMLIAGGHHEEIRFHTKMGLANGLTRAELEEIFYTAIPYCGFPAANTAKAAMQEAFAELDAQ